MPIDALDMTLVHRVFRREFHDIPVMIAVVSAGDTARAKVVADHLNFMVDALHHHHAAEDELAWPTLLARTPSRQAEIQRMEEQHRGIAAAINRLQSDLSAWTETADTSARDRLLASVAELSELVVQHLDDEERNAVPIIEEYLTHDEWQATVKRGRLSCRVIRGSQSCSGVSSWTIRRQTNGGSSWPACPLRNGCC